MPNDFCADGDLEIRPHLPIISLNLSLVLNAVYFYMKPLTLATKPLLLHIGLFAIKRDAITIQITRASLASLIYMQHTYHIYITHPPNIKQSRQTCDFLTSLTFFSARNAPPPDNHNASTNRASARDFHDDICSKNQRHHRKERTILRQGVLGCSCGCRNRPNDDLQRARQGVVSRAHERGIARRVQCKGRAGQRGAGIPFRMKILLPSSMAENLTYAGGVVLKNTMESGGLPTCDSRARMRTACSNMHRAATALAPKPFRNPPDNHRYLKRTRRALVIPAINQLPAPRTARAGPLVQLLQHEGLRTQSRSLCRHGARFMSL